MTPIVKLVAVVFVSAGVPCDPCVHTNLISSKPLNDGDGGASSKPESGGNVGSSQPKDASVEAHNEKDYQDCGCGADREAAVTAVKLADQIDDTFKHILEAKAKKAGLAPTTPPPQPDFMKKILKELSGEIDAAADEQVKIACKAAGTC